MERTRGRPFMVEWQESVEELAEQYRKAKQVARRTRLHALWLLHDGKSLEEVSQLLGVSYRTLQRWVAWYRAGGVAEVLRRTPGAGSHGQASYLSAEQVDQLRQQVDQGGFHTVAAIGAWMEQQWGVVYAPGSLYVLLRRLGIRKKVPRRQAEKADPRQQEAWKKGG